MSATDTLHAERARIDSRIIQLELEICELRRRRNSLAPISRLPAELLLTTFKLCRNHAPGVGIRRDWIPRVTHICRYWRDIAISCGSLWSTPDFSRLRLAEEMLQRSAGSSLSIVFDDDSSPVYEHEESVFRSQLSPARELLKSTLASEIRRIRNLDLKVSRSWLLKLLPPATPAPFLQNLTLFCEDTENAQHNILPGDLFDGAMPNLRVLSLTSYTIDLTHHGFSHIEKLFLKYFNGGSMEKMHTILRAMPRLRVLDVHDVSLNISEDYHPANVVLPNLQHLNATGNAKQLATFLAPFKCAFVIHYPDGTPPLTIRCTHFGRRSLISRTVPIESISQIASWISSAISSTPLIGLRIGGHILGSAEHAAPLIEFHHDYFDQMPEHNGAMVEAFIAHLPLGSLQTLATAGRRRVWGGTLVRAANISTIECEGASAEDVIGELRAPRDGEVLLPRLRRIVVRGVEPLPDVWALWGVLNSRRSEGKIGMEFEGCGDALPRSLEGLVTEHSPLCVLWNGMSVSG